MGVVLNANQHPEIDLSRFVSLAEAARRLPSTQAGKRVHVSTVYRLAVKHGVMLLRRGQWRYVEWEGILRLFTVELPARRIEPQPRRSKAQAEWTRKTLEEAGIL